MLRVLFVGIALILAFALGYGSAPADLEIQETVTACVGTPPAAPRVATRVAPGPGCRGAVCLYPGSR